MCSGGVTPKGAKPGPCEPGGIATASAVVGSSAKGPFRKDNDFDITKSLFPPRPPFTSNATAAHDGGVYAAVLDVPY